MNRIVATAMTLLTACLTAPVQTAPIPTQPQSPIDVRTDPPRAVNPTEGLPRFHVEARQVLITAQVWKRVADKHDPDESLLPPDVLRRYPEPIAAKATAYAKKVETGLTQSDFHVFDDGKEQRIDYFKKSTSPLSDNLRETETSWRVAHLTRRGTWEYPPEHALYAFRMPNVRYLIGYVPPILDPGKCHEVRLVVDSHDVSLDRNQYCAANSSDDLDAATREGTAVGTRMRTFANSEARGSVQVSARAFAFWSSQVLSLVTQNFATGSTVPPASDLIYVVEVHDSRAPATVHVAVQLVPPQKYWNFDCRQHPALHVLGIAYKENHEVAGQFGDTIVCQGGSQIQANEPAAAFGGRGDQGVPSRFDTQMDLMPGHYDLRVVVSDGQKKFGRAQVPLHVESFDGQQVAISDVVLSSLARDASEALDDAMMVSPAPLVPTPLVSKNVQFIPDLETRIPQHMRLPLYFEIYEPILKQQTTDVYMHLRVTNLRTGSVVLDSGMISAANWVLPGNAVIPLGFSLGTQNLDKGNYRVDVQASDAAARASSWRQANFTID